MERLQKFLAAAGVASRRQCEDLIRAGRVRVNGRVVDELGTKIEPGTDRVTLDGAPVKPAAAKVYLLLHKPQGYVTTARDQFGRPTVLDLLPGVKERVYPVGRLDYETEGLLLLTNDGELAQALTHPSHEITKSYLAAVDGIPAEANLQRLRTGIQLEDGLTAPAKVRIVAADPGRTLVQIDIHEGRNRQVRRMLSAIGHRVLSLRRVGLGFLTLDGVEPGRYRRLTLGEVDKLRALAACASEKDRV